jgi:hypothetical protein
MVFNRLVSDLLRLSNVNESQLEANQCHSCKVHVHGALLTDIVRTLQTAVEQCSSCTHAS